MMLGSEEPNYGDHDEGETTKVEVDPAEQDVQWNRGGQLAEQWSDRGRKGPAGGPLV